MLTRTQLHRAAREARKLADQVLTGRSPQMDGRTYYHYDSEPPTPNCALTYIEVRADMPRYSLCDGYTPNWPAIEATALVSDALFDPDNPPGAVAFPLLALADALDEQARAV